MVTPRIVMCPYCKGTGKLECEIPHPPKLLLIRALSDIRVARRLMPHKMVCPHCRGTGRVN
jgi:uncharacterized protein YbaR (Trm112 family)